MKRRKEFLKSICKEGASLSLNICLMYGLIYGKGGDQVTIKEFADKYDLPYHTVWEATYKVKPESTWFRDRDYPENKLKIALIENTKHRIRRYKKKITEQIDIKHKLEGVR